jgi:hypothetical protein
VARVAALSALARPQVVYALLRHCGPWALGVYYAHAAGTVGVPAFAVADAATWAIMARTGMPVGTADIPLAPGSAALRWSRSALAGAACAVSVPRGVHFRQSISSSNAAARRLGGSLGCPGRGALAIARRAGAWMTPSPGSDQPRWLQPGDWRRRYLQPICAEEGTICGNCLRIDDASDAAEDAARRHRPSIHRKAQAEGQECDERSRCEPHRWVRATGAAKPRHAAPRQTSGAPVPRASPPRGARKRRARPEKKRSVAGGAAARATQGLRTRGAERRHPPQPFFFTRGNAFTQLPRGCWNEPRRCGSPSRRRSSVLWRRRP